MLCARSSNDPIMPMLVVEKFPLVVMVPADEHQARNSGRESRLRFAVEKIGEWKKRHARKLKKVDVVRLLREGREER